MSSPSLPQEAVAALAARDTALAAVRAQLRTAEARAATAEAQLAETRDELIVVLKRLREVEQALEAATLGPDATGTGVTIARPRGLWPASRRWLGRLIGR